MDLSQIMAELKSYGSEQTRNIYAKHGAPEDKFGVKVGDMKKILKKTKKNQPLAEQLFATGNADAMYLGGLMADEKTISKETLNTWAHASTWYMVGEYAVAGVAAEGPFGWALGLEWIDSELEHVAALGWATLGGVVAHRKDDLLDLGAIQELLHRVKSAIHQSPNRVRYTMNGFVIAVGAYVVELHHVAQSTAQAIGKVAVNMGNTACKVPVATDYIEKIAKMNRVGKKKKVVRC